MLWIEQSEPTKKTHIDVYAYLSPFQTIPTKMVENMRKKFDSNGELHYSNLRVRKWKAKRWDEPNNQVRMRKKIGIIRAKNIYCFILAIMKTKNFLVTCLVPDIRGKSTAHRRPSNQAIEYKVSVRLVKYIWNKRIVFGGLRILIYNVSVCVCMRAKTKRDRAHLSDRKANGKMDWWKRER